MPRSVGGQHLSRAFYFCTAYALIMYMFADSNVTMMSSSPWEAPVVPTPSGRSSRENAETKSDQAEACPSTRAIAISPPLGKGQSTQPVTPPAGAHASGLPQPTRPSADMYLPRRRAGG